MNVSNFLNQFVDGDFVIVPGDRADIVAATLASALAPTFPAPSGVLLTGGLDALPGKNTAVGSLIDNAPFPVLSTTKDTFKSARAVSRVRGALESGHQRKLAAAMGGWDEHVNKDELLARLEIERPASMTPACASCTTSSRPHAQTAAPWSCPRVTTCESCVHPKSLHAATSAT